MTPEQKKIYRDTLEREIQHAQSRITNKFGFAQKGEQGLLREAFHSGTLKLIPTAQLKKALPGILDIDTNRQYKTGYQLRTNYHTTAEALFTPDSLADFYAQLEHDKKLAAEKVSSEFQKLENKTRPMLSKIYNKETTTNQAEKWIAEIRKIAA